MNRGAINTQLSPVGVAAKPLIPDPITKKIGQPTAPGQAQTQTSGLPTDIAAVVARLSALAVKWNVSYTALIAGAPRWAQLAPRLNGDAGSAKTIIPLLNGSGSWDQAAANLLVTLEQDLLTAALAGATLQAGAQTVTDGGSGIASVDIPGLVATLGGLLTELAAARATLASQGAQAPQQPQGNAATVAALQQQVQTLTLQVTSLTSELKTANAAAAAAASVCGAKKGP